MLTLVLAERIMWQLCNVEVQSGQVCHDCAGPVRRAIVVSHLMARHECASTKICCNSYDIESASQSIADGP